VNEYRPSHGMHSALKLLSYTGNKITAIKLLWQDLQHYSHAHPEWPEPTSYLREAKEYWDANYSHLYDSPLRISPHGLPDC